MIIHIILTTLIFDFQQDPYTMSKGSQLEGYCMDLLTELAKKLGFRYKVHLVKDGSYGRQDESGNWNGMIGEVVRGVCYAFYRKIHNSTYCTAAYKSKISMAIKSSQ